jgi:hypothetical protein
MNGHNLQDEHVVNAIMKILEWNEYKTEEGIK